MSHGHGFLKFSFCFKTWTKADTSNVCRYFSHQYLPIEGALLDFGTWARHLALEAQTSTILALIKRPPNPNCCYKTSTKADTSNVCRTFSHHYLPLEGTLLDLGSRARHLALGATWWHLGGIGYEPRSWIFSNFVFALWPELRPIHPMSLANFLTITFLSKVCYWILGLELANSLWEPKRPPYLL